MRIAVLVIVCVLVAGAACDRSRVPKKARQEPNKARPRPRKDRPPKRKHEPAPRKVEHRPAKVSPLAYRSCRLKTSLKGHNDGVGGLAVSPDGTRLASASGDKTLMVWKTATWTRERVLFGHERAVRCLDFLPGGRTLVSGGGDDSVRFWNVRSGALLHTIHGQFSALISKVDRPNDGHRASVTSIVARGKTIYTGSNDGTVRIWDSTSRRHRFRIDHNKQYIARIDVDPSERWLVFGDFKQRILVWDLKQGKRLHRFSHHNKSDYGERVAFVSPNTVASAGGDGVLRVWDIMKKKRIGKRRSGRGPIIAIAARGGALITGHTNGYIVIWDPQAVKPTLSIKAADRNVTAIELLSRKRELITASYPDPEIKVWQCEP